jgi:hypothetical protein
MAVDRAGVPGDEELQVLRQLVQLVALAIEALRAYAEEHVIALTLQRSLLPPAPPEIPGLAIAFRYLPASDQAEVGGDFYEALRWQDRVLVAIGDVQGHSLHAATVMGELRYALRAFVLEGHSPLAITGLVEERGVFIDVNLEKLRVAAQEASGADVEAFSNHVMSIFGPREDDVAMVAVRRK